MTLEAYILVCGVAFVAYSGVVALGLTILDHLERLIFARRREILPAPGAAVIAVKELAERGSPSRVPTALWWRTPQLGSDIQSGRRVLRGLPEKAKRRGCC